MLIRFTAIRTIGEIRKKIRDIYFSFTASSWILEISDVPGIKKLFIKSIIIIKSGTLNHHQLTTDLSLAFMIA
jgi:hypothetical protein